MTEKVQTVTDLKKPKRDWKKIAKYSGVAALATTVVFVAGRCSAPSSNEESVETPTES